MEIRVRESEVLRGYAAHEREDFWDSVVEGNAGFGSATDASYPTTHEEAVWMIGKEGWTDILLLIPNSNQHHLTRIFATLRHEAATHAPTASILLSLFVLRPHRLPSPASPIPVPYFFITDAHIRYFRDTKSFFSFHLHIDTLLTKQRVQEHLAHAHHPPTPKPKTKGFLASLMPTWFTTRPSTDSIISPTNPQCSPPHPLPLHKLYDTFREGSHPIMRTHDEFQVASSPSSSPSPPPPHPMNANVSEFSTNSINFLRFCCKEPLILEEEEKQKQEEEDSSWEGSSPTMRKQGEFKEALSSSSTTKHTNGDHVITSHPPHEMPYDTLSKSPSLTLRKQSELVETSLSSTTTKHTRGDHAITSMPPLEMLYDILWEGTRSAMREQGELKKASSTSSSTTKCTGNDHVITSMPSLKMLDDTLWQGPNQVTIEQGEFEVASSSSSSSVTPTHPMNVSVSEYSTNTINFLRFCCREPLISEEEEEDESMCVHISHDDAQHIQDSINDFLFIRFCCRSPLFSTTRH